MDTTAILLGQLLFLTYLILGILGICFGGFILKKRPIVYKRYIEMILFLALFGILFSIFLSNIIFCDSFIGFTGWILFLALALSPIRSFRGLSMYNVTQEMVYKSILEMLQQNNISFEEKDGEIILPNLKADIKVNLRPFNQASINFKMQDKKIRDQFISDFKKDLGKKKMDKFPSIGLITIISGILLTIMVIIFRPYISNIAIPL